MNIQRRIIITIGIIIAMILCAAVMRHVLGNQHLEIGDYSPVNRHADILPDYTDVVMPPNIAPLNFTIRETATRYMVNITGDDGQTMQVISRSGEIAIDPEQWADLLSANKGSSVHFDVYAYAEKQWSRFDRFTNTVAAEPVDRYLVYRDMPAFNMKWSDMGIYQRDLQTGDTELILHNSSLNEGCLNCHTFLKNSPETMFFHIRSGDYGKGSVAYKDGELTKLYTKTDFNPAPAIYTQWHPSGKALAFSVNKVVQFAHTAGPSRDVIDGYSDLAIFLFDSNTVTSTPEISSPNRLETYPLWSPDGKYLYFCSAPKKTLDQVEQVRYDLMRIEYDLTTNTWSKLETVLTSEETGLSISLPRISPDGKHLMFCMMKYGCFAAFRPSSDLYLMDLDTGDYRKLGISSPHSDAYHSWSSNGRWVVFSSKSQDGFFTRPYFSYFDANGRFSKPLLLPQKNPAFYESHIRIFNRPELITKPIPLDRQTLIAAAQSGKVIQATLDPNVTWKDTDSAVSELDTYRAMRSMQE